MGNQMYIVDKQHILASQKKYLQKIFSFLFAYYLFLLSSHRYNHFITMAYIIERKVSGHIYRYKVEAYWDKDKKQARQRCVYLGPKEKASIKKIKQLLARTVSKNYGNIFFLEEISISIGLYDVLKECYPDNYKEILLNAFYEIAGESKNYLLHHFQDEHYFADVKTMYSSDVSSLHFTLGNDG
jgi:hypothetical protein